MGRAKIESKYENTTAHRHNKGKKKKGTFVYLLEVAANSFSNSFQVTSDSCAAASALSFGAVLK